MMENKKYFQKAFDQISMNQIRPRELFLLSQSTLNILDDIVNNLSTKDAKKVLSAFQGNILKLLIENHINNDVNPHPKYSDAISYIENKIESHLKNCKNPHQVNGEQVENSKDYWNANKIRGILVDNHSGVILDGATLRYNSSLKKFEIKLSSSSPKRSGELLSTVWILSPSGTYKYRIVHNLNLDPVYSFVFSIYRYVESSGFKILQDTEYSVYGKSKNEVEIEIYVPETLYYTILA